MLRGRIEYSEPNSDFNNIRGILSIRTDPKNEDFNVDNVILTGSKLKNCEWLQSYL